MCDNESNDVWVERKWLLKGWINIQQSGKIKPAPQTEIWFCEHKTIGIDCWITQLNFFVYKLEALGF